MILRGVSEQKIEPGHKFFSKKWVFKGKKDVNKTITRFKTRCIVKDYLYYISIYFNQIFAVIVRSTALQVWFAIGTY